MKLHEFVDWFREDVLFKAPEEWPAHLRWFLGEVKERYADVDEQDAS